MDADESLTIVELVAILCLLGIKPTSLTTDADGSLTGSPPYSPPWMSTPTTQLNSASSSVRQMSDPTGGEW
ncbi:hypothetical protein RHSIM_Rhsim10G0021900 [Rhododendron simsii]|uniref:Uncharacterized protein n=1 Tax=Rhododendron simsii TaxID=118357 RepID=A0A834GFH3_RHOSS|nr:hypothetical protein RHSIM_Rhsim10G0021900 [Rhododendron simsii]